MNGFSRGVVVVVLVVVLIGTGLGIGGAVANEHTAFEQTNKTLEGTVDQSTSGSEDPGNTTDGDDNSTTPSANDGSSESSGDGTSRKLSPDGRNVTDIDRLPGEGETNVTVFENESYEQLADLDGVPYRNGTVLFGEAGYELANGSYLLLFESDVGDRFAVNIGAGDGDAAVSAIGGNDGFLPSLGSPLSFVAIVSILVVVLVGGIYFVRLPAYVSDGRQSTGGATSTMEVDVYVVDKVSNDLVDQSVRVEFRQSGRRAANRTFERTVAGQGTVELPQGRYTASFPSKQHQATDSVSPNDQQVTLSVGPQYHQVTVQEAGTGGGIPAATVELSFPDGRTDQDTTGSDGRARFEISRTVDTQNCELSVEHDRYRSTTTGLTDTVALEPLTGSARIDARLDGDSASDIDVVLKPDPDDGYTRRLADPVTGTTDADGTVTFDDLPVGTYLAAPDFADSPTVETTAVSVEVTGEGPTTETIDAEFTFQISDDQRRRIDDLHEDIMELTPSNRDGALPYYYGNVLLSVLSAVEEFEDSCAVFLRNGVDPDEATEATIVAIADAVAYTRTAMTNKQNVDLFSACRSLREARVKWGDDVTAADLVSFLGDGKANHRQEMISRLESVAALLDEKQDDVSTVTPARDQFEQVREHATALQNLSPVEQRAHFFVGLQLLDAIESTFEQPELVARLEETVF